MLFGASRGKVSKIDTIIVQFEDADLKPNVGDTVNADTVVMRYANYLKHLTKSFKMIDRREVKLSEGNTYSQLQATCVDNGTLLYLHLAFKFTKSQNEALIITIACKPDAHEVHKTEIDHVLATFVLK